MAYIGNTVRLKGEFRDYDGELTDIEDPKLTVYDGYKKIIDEFEPIRTDTGTYECDYVVPGDASGPLYYEFSGTLGGMPILGRAKIERKWV